MTDNFFDTLWPEKPDAYLSTWMKGDPKARYFHSSQFEEAHEYMIAMSKYKDAYFTVAMLDRPPQNGRGTAKDIGLLSCVHADFDFATDNKAHAKSALPKNIDELSDFLTEIKLMPPTVKVNSGNGIHAYWRFRKPLVFSDDAARAEGAALLKNFQKAVIRLAQEKRGWAFDNTSDLPRVYRYPGTKNHKTNPPKNVEILQ